MLVLLLLLLLLLRKLCYILSGKLQQLFPLTVPYIIDAASVTVHFLSVTFDAGNAQTERST